MLELSKVTFDRMGQSAEDQFVQRVVDFLYQHVPGLRDESHEAMFQQVRLLKRQAATHNLFNEQAVATFALTAALLGLDFVDRFRGVRQILFKPCDEDRKAELLQAFTLNMLETLGRP